MINYCHKLYLDSPDLGFFLFTPPARVILYAIITTTEYISANGKSGKSVDLTLTRIYVYIYTGK